MADQMNPGERGRLDEADFSGMRLHAPNFENVRITDGWFAGADISADIEGLVLNGVEVGPLVSAELDRRHPERLLLRASDPPGLAEAWAFIETTWDATMKRAKALPEPALHESVDGEWSFIETLRHLVLATDCWLSRMILGRSRPFHPWGVGFTGMENPGEIGLQADADPTLEEILPVRRERMAAVAATIADLAAEQLDQVREPPDEPGHPSSPYPVLRCLHIILNEEWEHSRYANRDLTYLEVTAR